jgi:hypothetical protein
MAGQALGVMVAGAEDGSGEVEEEREEISCER